MEELKQIAKFFLPDFEALKIQALKGGIIHQTYQIFDETGFEKDQFILQKINLNTFQDPGLIMENIDLVYGTQLRLGYPLEKLQAIKTIQGKWLHFNSKEDCWRMFNYIPGSVSFVYSSDQDILFEMGKAYGLFLTAIKDIGPAVIGESIPDFHNLHRRFVAYQTSLKMTELKPDRRLKAGERIRQLVELYGAYKSIDFSKLNLRATHNDCKLSNILLDKDTLKAKAVIDLDTLMPGYVATDFGDMVRSVCNSVSEDEADLSKVFFNFENFKSMSAGFLSTTKNWLSREEQSSLLNGAVYIILEQALRFMTDYLNGDTYYHVNYSDHNLDRARNQITLLKSFLTSLPECQEFINRF